MIDGGVYELQNMETASMYRPTSKRARETGETGRNSARETVLALLREKQTETQKERFKPLLSRLP